jgi:hypothetical protein
MTEQHEHHEHDEQPPAVYDVRITTDEADGEYSYGDVCGSSFMEGFFVLATVEGVIFYVDRSIIRHVSMRPCGDQPSR